MPNPSDPPALDDGPSTFMPFKSGSGHYDPTVARDFFKTFGQRETFTAGQTIFVENEKSKKRSIFQEPALKALMTPIDKDLFAKIKIHRMYLLTDGQVALSSNGAVIDSVWPGDVFGEMAVLSEIPDADTPARRTATAQASSDCKGYSLDGDETQRGLAQQPEFAMMLMSVMFSRLRQMVTRLASKKDDDDHHSNHTQPVFAQDMLDALQERLERALVVRYRQEDKIMKAGSAGTTMYIVLEGEVAVTVGRKIVDKLVPGCVFGEMALVDQSPRTAGAFARTECALLSINREALIGLMKSDPAIGMAMMRSVAERMRYMLSLFH